MNYHIYKAEYPIALIAGHDYWVIKDDTGKILTELHGLATSADGQIKAVGYLPNDKIKTYLYGAMPDDFGIKTNVAIGETIFSQINNVFPLGTNNPQKLVFSGTGSEVYSKVAKMVQAGHEINELDLGYPFLGFYSDYNTNSNAVNHTLGLAAKLPDVAVGNLYNPGEDINLLDGKKYYVIEKGVLQQLSNTATAITHDGQERIYGDKTFITLSDISQVIIDKITYTVGQIVEASQVAYEALEQFAKNTVSPTVLTSSLNTALNATFTYIGANYNNLNATNILKTFATAYGIANISASITQTDLIKQIGHAINGTQLKASNGTWLKNTNGVELHTLNPEGYGGAIVNGLIGFGVTAVAFGNDWNSGDWIRTGSTTVGSVVKFANDNMPKPQDHSLRKLVA